MMITKRAVLGVVVLLVGIRGAQSYTMESECNACVKAGKEWIVYPNCSVGCEDYNSASSWKRKASNRTNTETFIVNCSDLFECEILEDYIKNPSFESSGSDKVWTTSKTTTICTTNTYSCTRKSLDGDNYFWMCGYGGSCVASLAQDIVIPREATHVSLFVIPQLSQGTTYMIFYIDDTFVTMLTSEIMPDTYTEYVPLDIYIKPYADGGKHTLNFTFYENSPSSDNSGTIIIDYVKLTKINGLNESSHILPKDRLCSERCSKKFISNGICVDECNNYMCSYTGGSCNNASDSKNSKNKDCYNGNKPSDLSSLFFCKNYIDYSCCSELEANTITETFSEILGANNNSIPQKCYNLFRAMLCAPCSGKNSDYINEDGKLTFHESFVSNLWDQCGDINIVYNGKTGILKKTFTDAKSFIENFLGGTVASVNSFSYEDYLYPVKKKASGTLFIVGIILIAVVVVAVVVSLIVFLVVRNRKLNPKKKEEKKKATTTTVPMTNVTQGVEMSYQYNTGIYSTIRY